MEYVVGILKDKHGKTDDDIDALLAFESEYFLERVHRVVPAPVLLHKRVKVVFEVLGPMKDKKKHESHCSMRRIGIRPDAC